MILGLEPRDCQDDEHRVRVVEDRLRADYRKALDRCMREYASSFEGFVADPLPREIELPSMTMLRLEREYHERTYEVDFTDWLFDKRAPQFDEQAFSRPALVQWLRECGLRSAYQFERQTPAPMSPLSRWPWGDHETAALRELEAAARAHWSAYDPSKPRTAPKNDVVSDWLQKRGMSRTMADALASLLRADDLPTGPRR